MTTKRRPIYLNEAEAELVYQCRGAVHPGACVGVETGEAVTPAADLAKRMREWVVNDRYRYSGDGTDLIADALPLVEAHDGLVAELHEWRTKRLHGGCAEDLLAEQARCADLARENAELRSSRSLSDAHLHGEYLARIQDLERENTELRADRERLDGRA